MKKKSKKIIARGKLKDVSKNKNIFVSLNYKNERHNKNSQNKTKKKSTIS